MGCEGLGGLWRTWGAQGGLRVGCEDLRGSGWGVEDLGSPGGAVEDLGGSGGLRVGHEGLRGSGGLGGL